MKKKYGLFSVLTVMLMLIVVATYFVKGREGEIAYLPLLDVFFNYINSFYYFFDTAMYILIVGGFYGFLNHVSGYKKLVKNIANKFNEKGKVFIIASTIIFALVSSLTGLNQILLLFIPFVISIILLLGYDKLIAISATIGGVISGLIGGIFITIKDSSGYYDIAYNTIDKVTGLESNIGNLFPKILLLVVVTGLLIFYMLSHIKKAEENNKKYKLSKSDNLFVEVKDRTGKVIKLENKKTKVWPLIVILVLLFIVLVLGYLPWKSLFGFDCFQKFHNWLAGLKVGEYQVFTSLISANLTPLGQWYDMGDFMVANFLIIVTIFILMLIYRVKFEEAMDGFIYGAKKMTPVVMLVMLASTLLVCSYNNGFTETIIKEVSSKLGDNVVVHGLITAIGSVIHTDLYYIGTAIFTPITKSLTDTANLTVYSTMFQTVYGLTQLVGPTSILLIIGITYLDVPYKTWLKYIWRFILELIIAIIIILMIVSLL